MTILAGANGSGKSTLTTYARFTFQEGPVLDPDAVSVSINAVRQADRSGMEAGRTVLLQAQQLLLQQRSFTVETTLSGNTYVRMASRAKEVGFHVVLLFIGTTSLEINLERVRARVLRGGHHVPEADQRRRYPRTFANLRRLLPMVDHAILFDNSSKRGYDLVGDGLPSNMSWHEPLPHWAVDLKEVLPASER